MSDVVMMEVVHAVVLGVVVGFLLWEHVVHRDMGKVRGWNLIFTGFVLLLFASLLDIADDFPGLSWLVVGNTPVETFFEKIPGYLGGFVLLAIGFVRWMPGLRQLQHEIILRSEAELITDEQRVFLQSIIDAMPDPLMVISLDYQILLQNQASAERLPGSEPVPTEMTCHWLSHRRSQPCDKAGRACPLREVQRSGATVTIIHQHLDADNKPYTVELTASPFRNSEGELVGIIESARNISDRVVLQQRLQERDKHLQQLIWHDPLTGLYNRDYFVKRLQMALQTARRLAVLVIDIDGFKRLNEGLGHFAGDEILSEMASRLSTGLRSNDVLARNGDEFLLLTRHRVTTARTTQLARKILAVVGAKIEVAKQIVYPHASIGIAQFPEDGSDVATLLNHAETAAHRAFEAGGNQMHHYSAAEGQQAQELLMLEAGLREAIEKGQLVVYYQPQVDLNSGEVIGAEALVRWQHPQLGLVPPGKFIPLAETNGLIVALGEWVLRTACSDAANWYASGQLKGRIAVNLSARQFDEKGLVEGIAAILQQSGCPAAALELEVTESMMMLDADKVAKCLEQLRELGFKVAMDDFGTGYSSMLQLHRLPIDKIKIDQSFVRNLPLDVDAAKITRSIIALARSMDLEVIAEGIETQQQQEFLQAEGCFEGQGFLYSQAITCTAFATMLKKGVRSCNTTS
ncbi:MAG TPA: EAL domain-containing protein [Gammaproteobacteria bacterium]|nr:EAL domain-containing protein [Gammaproteobacteria bacterium]